VDFAEVFQKKGGFDLMIANPPYVRQEKIKHLKASLKQVYPDVYHGVADVYVYFYAQGLRQLRDEGTLVYISSNKFMRAGYGKTLRRLLGQKVTLRTVIDFGDLPIFEATTYPTVLVVRNRAPTSDHAAQALTVDDMAVVGHLADAVRTHAWPQPQASLRPDGWTLVPPHVRALLEKLRGSGTPLGEYVGEKFYRGIVTGLNKAFVIDRAMRDRLVAEDSRSAEIIKPWLRGRDVKRWRVEWAGLYVIFTRRGIDIEQYPAVRGYLSPFKHRLMPGAPGGRKPGNYQWYEIQDTIDYYAEFEKPKIVWPDIARRCEFGFDDQGFYPDCTLFIVPDADLYLVGILNSAVVECFYRNVSPTIQRNFLRFKRIYLSQIPIPQPTSAQRAAIEDLVHKLLDAYQVTGTSEEPVTSEWERELNELVYEVYGLTDEEIAIVEGPR